MNDVQKFDEKMTDLPVTTAEGTGSECVALLHSYEPGLVVSILCLLSAQFREPLLIAFEEHLQIILRTVERMRRAQTQQVEKSSIATAVRSATQRSQLVQRHSLNHIRSTSSSHSSR